MDTQRPRTEDPKPRRAPDPRAGARTRKSWLLVAVAAVAVCSGLGLGFLAGRSQAPAAPETASAEPGVKWWTCSMDPQVKMPEHGLCPVCGMDLIPLDDDPSGPRELKMSAAAMALAEIQVEPVRRQHVSKLVRMVGKVDHDETRMAEITAWVRGRLDRLYVDYTGITVHKGDHLVEMYSPDLVIVQRELLQAWEAYQRSSSGPGREAAARTLKRREEKLQLLGLLDKQIERIKARGTPSDYLTIYAPVGGVVTQRHANEGEYVQEGTKIYTIVDLSQVWVYLDAYESDIPWLRYGQQVEFTTESHPGKTFPGTIVFIDPVLNQKTRTSRVRLNVPNDDLQLKPGMFVDAVVHSRLAAGGRVFESSLAGKWISPHHPEIVKDGPGKCDICGTDLVPAEELGLVASERAPPPLVIPASAPLITGKRAVVYVRVPTSADLHREMASVWKAAEHPLEGREPTFATLLGALETAFSRAERLKRRRDAVETPPPPREGEQQKEWNFDALFRVVRNARQAAVELSQGANPTVDDLKAVIRAAWDEAGKLSDWERPSFEGREIELGQRAGQYYLVRRGLEQGEQVVTSGNFKIDSALQIQAKPSMMSSPDLDVPHEFRHRLSALYDPYFQLHAALNDDRDGDRWPDAWRAFNAIKKAVHDVPGEILDRRAGRAWQKIHMRLIRNVADDPRPANVKELRERFAPLAVTMVELVDSFGHAQPQTLYEAYCSMAFRNRGAGWLQAGREPANPYFGRGQMLKCVEIKRYWRTSAETTAQEDPP